MANSNFKVKNGLDVGALSVSASTGDLTTSGNITVTGTGNISVAGDITVTGNLTVDGGYGFDIGNLLIDENTISTSNVNGYIELAPNGTGDVYLTADTVRVGDSNAAATITTNGTGNLTLSTNNGTNSGTIAINQGSNGNIVVTTNGSGNFLLTSSDCIIGKANQEASIVSNGSGNLKLSTNHGGSSGNITINAGTNGNISISANGTGYIINDTKTLLLSDNGEAASFLSNGALTDAVAVVGGNVNAFTQFALINSSTGDSASTDLIIYADNGTNDNGWIDLGMTNSGFEAAAFGITEAGDGYIFMSAPGSNIVGGNLVICTGDTGTQNDIVFATNGFTSTTEQGRFISDVGFQVKGDLISLNGTVYQGADARTMTVDVTASTTLNGGINNSATTITVVSTTNFNSKGTITIGTEDITYTGKTSTTFTGCTRGANGTTAASHLTGAAVTSTTFAGFTNSTAVYTGDVDDFVQFAIHNNNTGASASTDLIAYASDGDNNSGWIDLGITSETYSDPAFTVTGPGTGYLFYSAPLTTSGTGDLLIGTDNTGSNNDIVFFTNGFDAGNERVRIIGTGANAGVVIYANTASTSTTTGALRVTGGIGLQGNLNVGGNVSIVGNITLGGSGDTVSTNNLTVDNSYINLANNNTGDSVDIGFVGKYVSSGTKYSGLVRDASDSKYKLFTGITSAPTTTVDFTSATYGSLYLGALEVSNNTASTTSSTGALIVTGGAGVGGNIFAGGRVTATAGLQGTPVGNATASSGAFTTLTSNGATTFTAGTASTTTGTGTVVVTGGIGVSGNVSVGGSSNIFTGNTSSTNTTSGTVIITGGLGVSGRVNATDFTGTIGANSTSTGAFTTVSTSGTVSINSGSSLTALANSGTAGVGNIGASGQGFNTVFAKATSAQYADLAENYLADAAYEPGTVLEFGGEAEVTIAEDSTRRVAGVVSTDPAHLMNSHLMGENVVALALTGRVPCKVRGKINKGDMLVSAGGGFARPDANPMLGSVIGKALENFDGIEGIIEVVVGRL